MESPASRSLAGCHVHAVFSQVDFLAVIALFSLQPAKQAAEYSPGRQPWVREPEAREPAKRATASVYHPLRGFAGISLQYPGFRFAPSWALCLRPLRGLLHYTVNLN